MPALLDTIRHTVRRHRLAGPDAGVVIAVSGGSDSVALAYLARQLADRGEFQVPALAHFNHQLRPTSDRDEQFCRDLARTIDCPVIVDRGDVAARARSARQSIEQAARSARHEFLERARLEVGADCVALGHTRDDQAETVLLRLLRGAGTKGLAAMHPRNGRIIRPLLACRRADLRQFLAERDIPYVDDETNEDVAIPRNRVRLELLPFLERRFNPGVVDLLANHAELARAEWEWMEEAAGAAEQVVAHSPGTRVWTLDIAALRSLPLALQRLVIWRAMTQASPGRPPSFADVEAVLQVAESSAPVGALDAPGQRVERLGSYVVLTGRREGISGRSSDSRIPSSFFEYPLSVPGEVRLHESGCTVSAEPVEPRSVASLHRAVLGNRRLALVRSDIWAGPLAVRNRRPGDRFRPVGLGGSKKLQDFFTDRKIARRDRDGVPLVVDAADRIVWVAGYGIDEAFRVTDASESVVILRLTQV